MSKSTNITTHFLILLSLLFLTFLVSHNVPLHSDDYREILHGLSFLEHIKRYFTWSGRFVADYISTFILSIHNHLLINFVNSCSLILSIFFIVLLSAQLTNKKIPFIVYIYIYILYWLSNPNLGQTTFWITGASNYLWTNLIILFFLNYFCYTYNKKSCYRVLGLFLGLLAGCSNENTSIVLVFIVISLIFYFNIRYDYPITNGFPYLAGVILGTSLLLLAPGNYKRLEYIRNIGSYDVWFAKNLLQKIYYHVFYRSPYALKNFWPAWFSLAFIATIVFSKKIKSKTQYFYCILFLCSCLMSIFVMAISVSDSPRAYNGPLFFLLISVCCLFLEVYNYARVLNIHLCCIVFLFFVYFSISYIFIYYSYNSTRMQDNIRTDSIYYHKENGDKHILIPDYFFPRLIKSSDKFDLYHSPSMKNYFGVKKIEVNREINFDYSIIYKSKEKELPGNNIFSRIFIQNSNIFIPGTIVLEFNEKPYKDIKQINITINDNKLLYNIKIDKLYYVELFNRYYVGLQLEEIHVKNSDKLSVHAEINPAPLLPFELLHLPQDPFLLPQSLNIKDKKCHGHIDKIIERSDGTIEAFGWVVHSTKKKISSQRVVALRKINSDYFEYYPSLPVARPDLVNSFNAPTFAKSGYGTRLPKKDEYIIAYQLGDTLFRCQNLTIP